MLLRFTRGFLPLLLFVLSAASLFAFSRPAASQEDLSWLRPGDLVPDQFALSGESPSLEEVTDALLKTYGDDPALWPEEFRRIHETQVAFNRRALASPKFKGQFDKEALAKMKTQETDPLAYWARCLYDGWGFEEWFNNDHLTVQDVPRGLLNRFLAEFFPLAWRDIRSIVRVEEYMLGLSDKKFVPYNDYEGKVLQQKKLDVQQYNSLVEKAAEEYARKNDIPMLLLMSERIDANWVGDDTFEASLLKQGKRLSQKIQDGVNGMDGRFRAAFYRACPRLTYSWNAEPWSEDHVVFNGNPVQKGSNTDYVGMRTRIEHPYIGEKISIPEQRVTSGPALMLQWGTSPAHSTEYDHGAVVEKNTPVYMVTRKQYGETREFILSLYLDRISGVGYEVSFAPAGELHFPEAVEAELIKAVTGAFLEAAEECFGDCAGRTTKEPSPPKEPAPLPEERLKEGPPRRVTLQPAKVKDRLVDDDHPEGATFALAVWEEDRRVPQAEVIIRKPEVGTVSTRNAEGGDEKWLLLRTDPLGEATITYTPPPLTELKMLGPSKWAVRIAAEDKESGARASIAFSVSRPKGLDATVDHRVLPAFAGFRNILRFRFDGEDSENDRGEKYRIKITIKSGNGSLSLDPEGSGGRSAFAMEVEADKDHVLYYRWHGPRDLDEPATESILLQIPELELEETVTFSVGVALEIHSAQREQLEVEQPGLFVPVKVYVQDKFHPDLDMAEFFRAFLLKPALVISQRGFKPIEPGEFMPKLNLTALLDHIRGAGLPHDSVSLEPQTWSLAKDACSRWFLVAGATPGGPVPPNAFPGIILWDYGDYTFEISINVRDSSGLPAEPFGSAMTMALRIGPSTTGDRRADLILPMILTYSALFPGEEARQFSIRGRSLLQKGDLASALATVGEYFSKRLSSVAFGEEMDPQVLERLEFLAYKAHGLSGAELSSATLEESLSQAKLNFLCAAAGEYAEVFLSQGYDLSKLTDSPSVDHSSPELEVLEMIKGFLEGYGEYGILALTRENIQYLAIYDESGKELTEFHGQVFGGGGESRRVFFGKNSVVVPFHLGENLLINLRSKGKPVDAIKILPNGINVQRLGLRPGSETINVYGDVVRP
jgi:hypothetical protein